MSGGSSCQARRTKCEFFWGLGFRDYLDPKEPTFFGFLIMISVYTSLKRYVGYLGFIQVGLGQLRVQGLGFRVRGLWVMGLEFLGWGFQ